MKFIEYSEKMEQLKSAVENGGPGSPSELAARLQLSERTLLRMVQQLRDYGYPIIFNRHKNKYEKKLK